jgi:hypothetical protein
VAHERPRPVVAAHHLDADQSWTRRGRLAHAGLAQRADVDRLDLARAVPVQPDGAVRPDGVPDPGAPAEQTAGQLLDPDGHVEAGQPGQLFADHRRLEQPLRRTRRVLPVAPSAASRPGVRARRIDSVGRSFEHLDGVRAAIRSGILCDQSTH